MHWFMRLLRRRPTRHRPDRRPARPIGHALGWWIAGFEDRIAPERATLEERVRWGTETRTAAGDGLDIIVTFPDDDRRDR